MHASRAWTPSRSELLLPNLLACPSATSRLRAASRTRHNIGRVSRGSIISSTPNASAVRKGEVKARNSSSSSCSRATGSVALSISRLKATETPPSRGKEPHSADGYAILRSSPTLACCRHPGHPVATPHHYCHDGNRRLGCSTKRSHTFAQRSISFRLRTNHNPGTSTKNTTGTWNS